jgi:hypothetical protein
MSTSYESEIEIGGTYRDTQTGWEGIAVIIQFHQYQCEQVAIERMEGGDVKAYYFDAARLELVAPPAKNYQKVSTGSYQNPVGRTT